MRGLAIGSPASVALLAAIFLVSGCGRNDHGFGLSPPHYPEGVCLERETGTVGWLCSCQPGDAWVVRTTEDYEALFGCPLPPVCLFPPRPAPGEMLLVARESGSGCTGCLGFTCASLQDGVLVAEGEASFHGDCRSVISLGGWALLPAVAAPVRFEVENLGNVPGDPPC